MERAIARKCFSVERLHGRSHRHCLAVAAASTFAGQVIQIGSELMTILAVNSAANTYQVARQALGSALAAHSAGDSVLHLQTKTMVVPFGLNFFENKASVNFFHSINLPGRTGVCGTVLCHKRVRG